MCISLRFYLFNRHHRFITSFSRRQHKRQHQNTSSKASAPLYLFSSESKSLQHTSNGINEGVNQWRWYNWQCPRLLALKLGHDVTVIEGFPELRTTGLREDLRGPGIEV